MIEWGAGEAWAGNGPRRAENQRPTYFASPKTFIAMVVIVSEPQPSATNLDVQLGCSIRTKNVSWWVGDAGRGRGRGRAGSSWGERRGRLDKGPGQKRRAQPGSWELGAGGRAIYQTDRQREQTDGNGMVAFWSSREMERRKGVERREGTGSRGIVGDET